MDEHAIDVGTITLEVTHRCHRQCSFCYVPDRRPEPAADELTAEEFVRAARSLINQTGCKRVQLSGGEPLLRPDLLQIIDGLLEAGAKVSMITDGAHLKDRLIGELFERGVGPIQPTLLSGEPTLHDSMRGNGAFRSVTRSIAASWAAGLEVIVCMVVTRRNWQEAEGVAEVAFALGARGLAISRFCPAGAAVEAVDALMPDAVQVRDACVAAARVCGHLGIPLATAVTIPACVWEDPDHPPLRVGVCSLVGPRCGVTVGPDGGVRSCALSTVTVGNILDDSWEELSRRLWERQIKPMRSAIPGPCVDCAQLSRCLGGCRLSAEAVFGNFEHPDPLAPVSAWRGRKD